VDRKQLEKFVSTAWAYSNVAKLFIDSYLTENYPEHAKHRWYYDTSSDGKTTVRCGCKEHLLDVEVAVGKSAGVGEADPSSTQERGSLVSGGDSESDHGRNARAEEKSAA
jgi:hypothetical protein